MILFFFSNCSLFTFYTQRKAMLQRNVSVCHKVDSLAKDKYLVLDGVSNLIFDHRPGSNFVFKQPKNILLYDCGQLILGEPFLSYHRKICDCNPLSNAEFYNFLYRNRKQTIFLSSPERMSFVFGYLRFMHQLPYSYRELPVDFVKANPGNNQTDLHCYELIDKPLE